MRLAPRSLPTSNCLRSYLGRVGFDVWDTLAPNPVGVMKINVEKSLGS